jgi:hypothetical protein
VATQTLLRSDVGPRGVLLGTPDGRVPESTPARHALPVQVAGETRRLKTSLKKRDDVIPRSAGTRARSSCSVRRSECPFYGAVPTTAIDSDGFVLRRSLEQGRREATPSGMISVNVGSVVIYFAPFSHPHRAIAPAIFEITIGQAMHGLELVVFRL